MVMKLQMQSIHFDADKKLIDFIWVGYEPDGDFFDARMTEDGVYSSEGRWEYLD